MFEFASLFLDLMASDDSDPQLYTYFKSATDEDRNTALTLFLAEKPKRLATIAEIRSWAFESSGLPGWLLKEAENASGDTCETAALILGAGNKSDRSLTDFIAVLETWAKQPPADMKAAVVDVWKEMSVRERFVFNKLLSGTFRKKVALQKISPVLSRILGYEAREMSFLLYQFTQSPKRDRQVLFGGKPSVNAGVFPIEFADWRNVLPETLDFDEPLEVQPLPDTTRCQLVFDDHTCFIWSERHVLLGVLHSKKAGVDAFGRTIVEGVLSHVTGSKTKICHVIKVHLFNEKEVSVEDCNTLLTAFFDWVKNGDWPIELKPVYQEKMTSLAALNEMVKMHHLLFNNQGLSPCIVEKAKRHMKAVLLYAQRSRQPSGPPFEVLTFGIYKADHLVPVAKLNTVIELELEAWIAEYVRNHTVERYGPVLVLSPGAIFELTYSALEPAPRTKSGYKAVHAEIIRRLPDVTMSAVDRLENLMDTSIE